MVTFANRRSVAFTNVAARRGSWPLAQAHSAGLSDSVLPAAVVFDLDGCVWSPDMYMLWGGGAPFSGPDANGDAFIVEESFRDNTGTRESGHQFAILSLSLSCSYPVRMSPVLKGPINTYD